MVEEQEINQPNNGQEQVQGEMNENENFETSDMNGSESNEASGSHSQDAPKEETDQLSTEELIQEEKNKFLRLYAEFENYKKRTTKERIELYKTANKELMLALLPVLDDIDRAFKEMEKAGDKELIKGIQLIHHKLFHTLEENGLERMEVKAGDDLDTDKHEAITQIPAPEEKLKNKIIDCIETGYLLNDKVIRFAKVVVGQ